MSLPLLVIYAGLIFWTIGYDTIYACQDIEDDMKIGVKSTARWAEKNIARFVFHVYGACITIIFLALFAELTLKTNLVLVAIILVLPFGFHLRNQSLVLEKTDKKSIYLRLFKSNINAALLLISTLISYSFFEGLGHFK